MSQENKSVLFDGSGASPKATTSHCINCEKWVGKCLAGRLNKTADSLACEIFDLRR